MAKKNAVQFEYVSWDDVRRDRKYPISDNNKGFIFGLNFIDTESEEILDVQWFKTESKRDAFIKKNKLVEYEYNSD